MRFFWVLAKGEVREITEEAYFGMLYSKRRKHRFIGWIEPSANRSDTELVFVKGESMISLRLGQLQQILSIGGDKR